MARKVIYSLGLVAWQLGWVDLDLGSSPGWWAATVATYCPSRPGTPQILIFKTLRITGCPTVYIGAKVDIFLNSECGVNVVG